MTVIDTHTAQISPRLRKSISEKCNAEQIVLMSASALFAGLSPRDCSRILLFARVSTFAREQILYTQGQPVKTLVLIQSGSVKLTQVSLGGNEVILWLSGSGDALEVHNSASGVCNHTCSARAMEKCQALVWEYSHLQPLVAQYPQIGANILKILADRLRELEERFREIATEKVESRVALVLLRLLKSIGRQSNDGVELGLKREELAQMTGTTLFTISRILSRWGESGIVVPRRAGVLIRDPNRLMAALESGAVEHLSAATIQKLPGSERIMASARLAHSPT